jgi:diguanylate cyclase (GGDEF)-like protein
VNKEFKTSWWSIRNRILLITIVATALPAMVLGGLYYLQSRATLLANAEQELLGTATQVERGLDLWFQERYYELRILATYSYLVTENLPKINLPDSRKKSARRKATQEIENYLKLVRGRYGYYERLLVYDKQGNSIAQDPLLERTANLPDNWQDQLQMNKAIIGNVQYDEATGIPTALVAIPLLSADGNTVGFFAADLALSSLDTILRSFITETTAANQGTSLMLVQENGSLLASTASTATAGLTSTEIASLYKKPLQNNVYVNSAGDKVIGILALLEHSNYAVVVETNYDKLFANQLRLRNLTLSLVLLLLAVMGFVAWWITRGILRPLETLKKSAEIVAAGDMNIKLPVTSHDELGIATTAFNQMIEKLRHNQAELEQLTITDSLTGLMNRSKIITSMLEHIERYRRLGTPFSLLMIDVDYFKKINDQYGHLAGDAVLIRLGRLFSELTRSIDMAARYGGEEFLILLEDSESDEAVQTAQRIRSVIENSETNYEGEKIKFTISIGVAQISSTEQSVDDLVRLADEAMYKAKEAGRNRTVAAEEISPKVIPYRDKQKKEK